MRQLLSILIVDHAETMLRNPKSGLAKMVKERDVANLTKIFKLLDKSNMSRAFFKEFQAFIQS